ncbi:MAG: M23 family metallopeptidase [Candidatus Dormibacteria bacterium]
MAGIVLASGLALAATSTPRAADLPIPCAPLVAPPLCTAAPPPTAAPGAKPPPGTTTAAKPTPPTASPTPSPKPVARGALGVTGVIDDPALSRKVTEVLQHPVAAERPSLLHFKAMPTAATHATAKPTASGGTSRSSVAALVTMALLVGGLLGALLYIRGTSRRVLRLGGAGALAGHLSLLRACLPVRLRRLVLRAAAAPAGAEPPARTPVARRRLPQLSAPAWWGRRPSVIARPRLQSRSRLMTVVGVLVPATVIVAGFAVSVSNRSSSSPVPASRVGSFGHRGAPLPTQAPVVNAGALTAGITQAALSADWSQLVTIEQNLEKQRNDLTAQEAGVSRLSGALQSEPPNSPRAPQLQAQLQQLVSAHEVAVAVYDKLLQSEYEFFQGAVQSPPVRHNLVAVAAASGHPDAAPAVKYDLDVVEAQKNQEAALAAAEAAAPRTDPITSLLRSVGRPTLISPMGGAIEQGFGPTSLSFEPPVSRNGRFFEHFHTGIDISAPEGTPVHAAAGGRVILAAASVGDGGQLVGYGRYVAISHGNGFTTVYGHLDSINVKPGQTVEQGAVIGHEGSTGNSTGPHLHFETRVNGSAVDPAPYLRGVLHLR